MLFHNKDTIRWLVFSTFEIFMQLFALLITSILIMCKVEGISDMSWWKVLIPMFVADGCTLYFTTIVFIRTYYSGNTKEAFKRAIWVVVQLGLLLSFKILLCQTLEKNINFSAAEIMSPLLAWWTLLIFRACACKINT